MSKTHYLEKGVEKRREEFVKERRQGKIMRKKTYEKKRLRRYVARSTVLC